MKSIVLIGYMGAGKSSVAFALSRECALPFLDTDARIEALCGQSISDIFKEYGEPYFRDRETRLLKSLYEEGYKGILSTGGGMPLKEENCELMKKIGVVFYLKAKPSTIALRLSHDDSRPLLSGAKDAKEKEMRIAQMLSLRESAYEDAADQVINTDDLSVGEIVDIIIKKAKES